MLREEAPAFRGRIPGDIRELLEQCLLLLLPLRPQSLLAIETDEHDCLLCCVSVKTRDARWPPAVIAEDGQKRRIAREGVQVAVCALRQERKITYAQSTQELLVVLKQALRARILVAPIAVRPIRLP